MIGFLDNKPYQSIGLKLEIMEKKIKIASVNWEGSRLNSNAIKWAIPDYDRPLYFGSHCSACGPT